MPNRRTVYAPPRWADRLLVWFVAAHLLEYVQGDLHEVFHKRVVQVGLARARREYAWAVLHCLTPFFFKRTTTVPLRHSAGYQQPTNLHPIMIRNYLKIAFRNLKRQRMATAINVIGLAVGLATFILIMLYVYDELSYDRFHQKADRTVRLAIQLRFNGFDGATTLGPSVAQDLHNEYPEVLQTTRIRNQGGQFVSYGTTSFKEEAILFADSTFFDVFTFPLLKGNPKTALTEPNTLVLTEETARKYFGQTDPIGKILTFGSGKTPYRVTGIVGRVPANSHLRFNLLASLSGSKEAQGTSWLNDMNFYTYLVLSERYNYRLLEAKVQRLGEKNIGLDIRNFMGISLTQFRQKGNTFRLFLQPLTDIHLHPVLGGGELSPNGDIRYVYVLSAIALFMLLIACVNFMNLSTATASRRSREVGVRKVLGSVKGQLRQQFLLESCLLAIGALVVGLGLVTLALPTFNQLADKTLSLQVLADPAVVILLVVSTVLVGLLAGGYPAFYLASFKPILVLKGRNTMGQQGVTLRSGLVIFQFFITVSLIIATLTADRQLRYMQAKKVGYERAQVLVIHNSFMLRANEAVFREQISQYPTVISASVSGQVPVGETSVDNGALIPKEDLLKAVVCRQYRIDPAYIPTLGMRLIQGRNFSQSFPTDSSAVILNETTVRALGWQKNPIGKELADNIDGQGTKRFYRVIGVVSDFHFESLRQKITPLVMFLGGNSGSILVKTHGADVPQLLASLKQQWDAFGPAAPFTYSFLDNRFEQAYRDEQKIGQVLTLFSSLTILIACLGLFGLATYTTEARTKEIGVRKVLGASVTSIIALLSKDFLKPVLIALLLASPIAWWAMNQWLQEFAYKIELAWWMFALAGLLAVGIALLTVSLQSIRAALMNPVKSLRSE